MYLLKLFKSKRCDFISAGHSNLIVHGQQWIVLPAPFQYRSENFLVLLMSNDTTQNLTLLILRETLLTGCHQQACQLSVCSFVGATAFQDQGANYGPVLKLEALAHESSNLHSLKQ